MKVFSKRHLHLFLLLFMLFPMVSFSQQFPKPSGFVNDFAGVIKPETKEKMETFLKELKEKTGVEIAVVAVPDMGGYDIDSYSVALFKEWGIGSKANNDGLLIITAIKERKLRIEVGYGLEYLITDATAGRIQDNYIVPYLKKNDFDTGLLQGAVVVAAMIAKDKGVELTGSVPVKNTQNQPHRGKGLSIIQILIFLAVFFFISRGRGGGLLTGMLLGSMLGGGRRGYYGGGGFGGGFGDGGGFGGFGGGFSGGGGASRGF